MVPIHVAVVSEAGSISPSDVTRVAAALNNQVVRDFGPSWGVQASVDGFTRLEDVPVGYWPIIVEDNINTPGAAGVHLDENDQPFALVQTSDSWSLTASHECLEMLADPFGSRLVAGSFPESVQAESGAGRVEFLLEVCDPCEGAEFAYTVNGMLVSDFITPHFYDPVTAVGVRYSYTGAVEAPRDILEGGYISWHDPVTNHWQQLRFFAATKELVDLGEMERGAANLRAAIDEKTREAMAKVPPLAQLWRGLPQNNQNLRVAQARLQAAKQSTNGKAKAWRRQIDALKTHGSS
jgi:hypothetical protein